MSYKCPHCEKLHDFQKCITGPEDTRPREGDMTMCIRCGKFSAFDGEGSLRHLYQEEVQAIASDPEAFMMWLAWKVSHAQDR